MSDNKIMRSAFSNPSPNQKVHDLTMLYLNNQELTNITIDELAKKYIDTTNQLNSSLNSYRKTSKVIAN